MVLPNFAAGQKKVLAGDALAKYGTKQTDFNQVLSPVQKVVVRTVKKMQVGVQRNIAKKKQISSGNAYQTVGGGVAVDDNGYSMLVYFTVPNYLKYQDLGVRGAKSTYSSSRNSPFAYTNKKPPFKEIEKHLIQKYGVPKKNLYIATKRLQDKIFNKGIKGTKVIQSVITPKLIQQAERDISKVVKDFIAVQILEV